MSMIETTTKIAPLRLSRIRASATPFRTPTFSSQTRCFHNTNSKSSQASASTVAQNFLTKFQSIGPQTRTQVLDANQLQLLSLTLNRNTLYPNSPALANNAPAPAAGTPLPPGYHLVYFTPAFLESQLGLDGTDASYNPEQPFTRRMWAGGEVSWPRRENGKGLNLLRVGQEVRETTRMLSAEPKVVKKTGEEMIVVGVEKVFENEDGVAVVDRRNWVFREALKIPTSAPPKSSGSPPNISPKATPNTESPTTSTSGTTHTKILCQSPVTLFRFSALTFNAHKIHYSRPWAQEVEGHRDLVVHGPMNLIKILDLWRDVHTKQQGGEQPEHVVPESIAYRATNPLYAEEEYRIVLEEGEDKTSKANIYNPAGAVAMKADISV